jgi:hypothetical protein
VSLTATDCEARLIESATAMHFYTLLDGLMAIGHSAVLELPANVVHKVFRALEFGLLGDEVMNRPQALPPLLAFHTRRLPLTHSTTPTHSTDSAGQPAGGAGLAFVQLCGSGGLNHHREGLHTQARQGQGQPRQGVGPPGGQVGQPRRHLRGTAPHTAATQCVCR